MGKFLIYLFLSLGLTLLGKNALAAVPVISYSPATNVYAVGTAITTLTPSVTNGVSAFGFGTGIALTGATLSGPSNMAIDASGNVYVTNYTNNTISKYNSSGTYLSTFGSGAVMSAPVGIVFDSSGNAYVLNTSSAGNGTVYKYNSSGVYQSTIISGLNQALGIDIDASNNIYIADAGANTVKKYSTSGTLILSLPTTNLSAPSGVTVDGAGNIYTLNFTAGNITKYNSAGTFQSTLITGFSGPYAITTDGAGNIYVADSGNNLVKVYNAAGTFVTSVAVTNPEGLVVDNSGDLFVASYSANKVYEFKPTGGYFLSGTLPAGLSFNSSTGSISGTPTATMTATTYTVTAYNASGSGTTTVTITVNNPTYGNYGFSKTITLNTTTLGITSNLSSFPALLSIQDNDLIISTTCTNKVYNPNGPNYDLAFVSGGSELYYQVESYNQTTGTLLVWVQIPSLTYATNNTIAFYYGSTSPTVTHNTAFFANTWASDYKAVYHFNESAYSGSVTDGTAGAHTGTTSGMTSADLVTGKIGTAYSFNGSSKKITAGTVSITGAFTLSAWVKLGATGLDQKIMTNQDATAYLSGGYKLAVYNTNIPESESGAASNRFTTPNPTAFAAGAWHYVQNVYTGTTLSTFVDGVQYKTLTTSNNPSANLTLYIGVGEGGTIYYFNGTIDEPRVSNVAKTADWVKAEYGDQNSPTTFTTVGTTVTYTTNAAAIAGALTYTWTGATSTDPAVAGNWNNTTAGTTGQLPAFDGTATLIVPAGLSNYPALTVDASLYGLTIASGGSLNLNGHTLSVGCNIYNNATTGGTGILYGSNTASGITWNGTSSAQTFTGANTANTAQLGNMTVNNSSAGTVTITGGPVDVYNTLTITKGNLVINNAGNGALTLKSSSALTASVAVIPSSYSITGSVNVERFLTGGSTVSGGRWVYRNYRLMSSPVNAGLVSSKYPYTINYIAASAIVTGAKSSFGTLGGNPTIYVYSEDYTPSNASFTSGNFKGVTDMSTLTSPYTLTISNNGTTKALYVGNGFMFFFRGDKINSVGTSPGKTTYPYVAPESVVFTATGNLNQGSYTVNNWQTGSGLLFTTVAGNSAIQGFNLVGNPYASTIDWEAVNSGGIVATNLNPSIYVFNPVTNQYNTYSSSTHVGNPVTFTGKIASGQGFFVKANNTSPSLVFNESAKSTTVINAGSGNLMMGTPAGQAVKQQLFRLRLSLDSINYDDIAIGFKSTASEKYDLSEDSKYLTGLGALEGLASYSGDTVPEALAINFLPLPKKAPRVIKLKVTAKNSGRLTLEKTQLDSLPKIYELWLMDRYKRDSLDIRHNSTYIFDIDRNDTMSFGDKRFELVIRQDKALGIHLLDFRAAKATGGVLLTWKVENEGNYTNFTVERSTDNGASFTVLGGSASNSQGIYTFLDSSPANAVNIYRVKIEDLNGTISYTKAIAISYNSGTGLTASTNIAVYPNPAVGLINLNINQPELATLNLSGVQGTGYSLTTAATQGSYSIKIINVSGAVIQSATSSQPTWQGDVSALQPGTYILQVLNNKDKSIVGKTTFVKL